VIGLEQRTSPIEANRWKWSVWLGGTSTELDSVDSVTYYLHPTFVRRVRKITDRNTRFRLDSSGWGEFTLRARVTFKTGEVIRLTHRLTFGGEGQSSRKKGSTKAKQRIFISSSIADSDLVSQLRKHLVGNKIDVVTASDLPMSANLPIKASIEQTLKQASAVIAIASDMKSPWTAFEVKLARRMNKPVITISRSDTIGFLAGGEPVLKEGKSSKQLVNNVIKALSKK
jgi:transcription initiation factor IIF auxiliary subunit